MYGVGHLEELDVRTVSREVLVQWDCQLIINAWQTGLPSLDTILSAQIRNILAHYERLLGHALPVNIARQNVDGSEMEFANMLVEDANNDALSYTECEWYGWWLHTWPHWQYPRRPHVRTQVNNRRIAWERP
jgi:hypothetical protein